MGDKLTLLLVAEYIIIAAVYLCEKNWAKMLYFVGAVILTIGVLLMKGD